MKEVRVALIGYGGIARSHNHGYRRLVEEGEPVRLVAVCDINEEQFKNQIGINIDTGKAGLPEGIHTYTDVDGLDYRILLETDFLVNAYEFQQKGKVIYAQPERILQTETGRILFQTMFSGQ